MVRVDGDDDLDVGREALEHAELDVGLEAGQHAGGVVVVEELAAELEVELAAELSHAFADVLGLQLDVLVVVESGAHGASFSARGRDGCCFNLASLPRARRRRGKTRFFADTPGFTTWRAEAPSRLRTTPRWSSYSRAPTMSKTIKTARRARGYTLPSQPKRLATA